MRYQLINWIVFSLLILPNFIHAQIVSGSINTPSGYSIDLTTGNLIGYDSSLKTNNGVTSNLGGFAGSFNATDGYTFSYVNETIGFAGVSLSGFNPGYQNTGAVFVTGFMYGLKYRFPCANQIGGSCSDTNGLQDNLRVEIGYYPYSGSPDFRIHQLGLKNINDGNSPYNPVWQQLAETYTFAGAKPLYQAGAVNMSIIGQDAGFWACLMPDCYGPQVKDAYIRANYSVDPCILNPAFSPSCPGFSSVLQGAQSPLYFWGYNIAQRLPHIGGGVQVHGFDYGFSYYAGDYCTNTFMFWCTSSSGANGGTINFRITDKNNVELFKDSQYAQGNYSGGSYSNRYLFAETQNSLNLGSIQWYATNVWGGNFQWAGWTRPIWSPDPCYTQPLYSPNCSNFDATIKKLAEEQEAARQVSLSNTVNIATSTPTSTITTNIQDSNSNTTVNVNTVTPPPAPRIEGEIQPKPPKEDIKETARPESNRASITRIDSTIDSTAQAFNTIRQNQQRENILTQQASQTAIQTANTAAVNSMRQAEALALDLAKNSQGFTEQEQRNSVDGLIATNKQNQTLISGPQPGSTSIVNIGAQTKTQQNNIDTTSTNLNTTSTSAIVVFNAMQADITTNLQDNITLQIPNVVQSSSQNTIYQVPIQSVTETKPSTNIIQDISTNTSQLAVLTPAVPALDIIQQNTQLASLPPVATIELPQTQLNFITDKTNPINAILEQKTISTDNEKEQAQTTNVKQDTKDSDVAGPVSISTINVVPIGFNAYTVALADANFYQPKEIYRNQRTVDNRRALQNLRSDQLHEQMINQQWR